VLAFVVGAAVLATGCDDSGPLAREAYAKKADSICNDFNNERKDARDELGRNPTDAQIQQAVDDVLVPSLRDQVRALRKLEAVETDRLTVARIWDDYADGVDEFARAAKDDVRRALVNEPSGIRAARREAAAYGMTICSSQ
jgi:hypothetical protein